MDGITPVSGADVATDETVNLISADKVAGTSQQPRPAKYASIRLASSGDSAVLHDKDVEKHAHRPAYGR